MASADTRAGDRHKHAPIAYRPPVDVREWLLAHAEASGMKVSALMTQALREYREKQAAVMAPPLPQP